MSINMKLSRINNTIFLNIILTFAILIFLPKNAQSETLHFQSWLNLKTNNEFSKNIYANNFLNKSYGLQALRKSKRIRTNFTIGNHKNKMLFFDQSFIEYVDNNKTFGIGKINRHWSFSPYTSLILSSNARPSNSIYIKFNNTNKPHSLLSSLVGPWSFEGFNSILSNSSGPQNSMLLGLRVVVEPIKNFKFELIKTSQWGGSGHDNSLSAFQSATLGNSNSDKHSNINQMAGFGFSYLMNERKMPIRLYAQLIGEDEAGNLPSCYIHQIGNELTFKKNKFITKFGFEYVDTRVGVTSHNNCGPNTAYNNNTYQYTNYGTSMGAPIDTEGKSINLWAQKKISNKLNIQYSVKTFLINDTNWAKHRISSTRQNGWKTSFGASWKFKSTTIQSNIEYQDFSLNKIGSSKGLGLNLSSQIIF